MLVPSAPADGPRLGNETTNKAMLPGRRLSKGSCSVSPQEVGTSACFPLELVTYDVGSTLACCEASVMLEGLESLICWSSSSILLVASMKDASGIEDHLSYIPTLVKVT